MEKYKKSPKEILERMKAAQAELEEKEAERAKNLLGKEQEFQGKIAALQEDLKEAEQTLELAKNEIAGKKEVSEEYTAGILELEQIATQIQENIEAVYGELAEIQNDPGVAERRLREKEEEERKAQREQAEAEAKKIAGQLKEREKMLQKLAQDMISFLVKDAGWAFNLDHFHQPKCVNKGGLVAKEINEIEKKISPLTEECGAVWSKLEEKTQGLLKFGTKELEDRLRVLNGELAAFQAQIDALTAKANEKIRKFEGVEKSVRGEMRAYNSSRRQVKELTNREPEGVSLIPVKDTDMAEAGDGHLRNYLIYKNFLKQFGFNADDPATWEKWREKKK